MRLHNKLTDSGYYCQDVGSETPAWRATKAESSGFHVIYVQIELLKTGAAPL